MATCKVMSTTQNLCQDLIKAYGIPSSYVNKSGVKRSILSLLSDATLGRINQFEVNDRLEGLVEKCRILNNDPLADALQSRLQELSTVSNDWTPEILSLLLNLSDRPVQKARLEDLIKLQPETASAPLTWQDIIHEDPLEDQTAVWRSVDFTADGSDEDVIRSASPQAHTDTNVAQCPWAEELEANLERLLVPFNQEAHQTVSDVQNWRGKAVNPEPYENPESLVAYEVTERMTVREVIFMLLGLPTSIFDEGCNGYYRIRRKTQLINVSQDSVSHLLSSFIEIGQKLDMIRHWIEIESEVPLEQTFRFALQARLRIFHSTLHTLQTQMLDPSDPFVPTLLSVYNEACSSSRLLIQLHDVLTSLVPIEETQRPFELLQSLYNLTCASQKNGDDEGYEYMARIFIQCFQTYLKHVLAWMQTGEIDAPTSMMFITKLSDEVSLPSLWKDQYRVAYKADGTLKAPQFLHVAARKILNTGKSVNFLRKLGFDVPAPPKSYNDPLISYDAVCPMSDPRKLSPFSELFDVALEAWIASKYQSASSILRDQLDSRCGLQKALTALEYVYFYRNGPLTSSVMWPIFERLERTKERWNDAFTTTESFHEAFASVNCIDLDCLSACPAHTPLASNSKQRSMDMLGSLSVSYALPWPVANIIRPQSMPIYQRVFILLSQISRAKYLLERPKLSTNATNNIYAVRTSLLWFVNTLLSHLTMLVIEINTAQMRHDLSKAEDVDAMIAVHEAYIARLEDQCFLTKQRASLRQAVISILDLTVLFSDVQNAEGGRPSTTEDKTSGRLESGSSSDEEEEATREARPVVNPRMQPHERLVQIHDTYTQLLTIVTAAVESISKRDGGPVWEILAANLAFGTVR